MSVSEMMDELIRAGHLSPRNDAFSSTSLGSYRQIPTITLYGNAPDSAMMAATNTYAKLEQYPTGN